MREGGREGRREGGRERGREGEETHTHLSHRLNVGQPALQSLGRQHSVVSSQPPQGPTRNLAHIPVVHVADLCLVESRQGSDLSPVPVAIVGKHGAATLRRQGGGSRHYTHVMQLTMHTCNTADDAKVKFHRIKNEDETDIHRYNNTARNPLI